MARPRWEVADIFREHGAAYRARHPESLLPEQSRVMRAVSSCRTAALGGHVDGCMDCGHRRISYNSCRNRHCPKCQSLDSRRWLEKMVADLLPIQYFHVVFTLPEELAPLALQNKRVVYNQLFSAVSETLRKIAADPRHLGVEMGYLAVLHTWGQQLQHHPHLHCVVTGGGLALDGSGWKSCRRRFFLPVKVLSKLFRRLLLEGLESKYRKKKLAFYGRIAELNEPRSFVDLIRKLRQQKKWVVYAKPPFGSPEKVLNYLGRYTHRVAISNDRIVNMEDGKVSLHWKDYRHQNQQRVMTITAEEFIRRYMLHLLPRSFQRIRHFGLLSNRGGKAKLERARQLLGCGERKQLATGDYRKQYENLTGRSLSECPECGSSRWRRIELLLVVAPILITEKCQDTKVGARLDSS